MIRAGVRVEELDETTFGKMKRHVVDEMVADKICGAMVMNARKESYK